MDMLEKIRAPKEGVSKQRQILYSVIILLFGCGMGVFSKALDLAGFNELPYFMQRLDITNFLGRFAIWIFIAVCISVYSSNAFRAALNVFLFFIGMVTCYFLYSKFVGGFFSRNYAMIWYGFTAASPFLAFACWYAKGKGWPAIAITGAIIGVLFSQAVFLFQGIRIAHWTEVIVWLASLWVLRRKPKEFCYALGIALVVALIVQKCLPYWG